MNGTVRDRRNSFALAAGADTDRHEIGARNKAWVLGDSESCQKCLARSAFNPEDVKQKTRVEP